MIDRYAIKQAAHRRECAREALAIEAVDLLAQTLRDLYVGGVPERESRQYERGLERLVEVLMEEGWA